MGTRLRIGLVGNYDASAVSHQAIPVALRLSGEALGVVVEPEWVPSEEIEDASRVEHCHGIWCVPASPYRSMEGALRAIRFAREQGRPFIGTCGGFQHAVIEYARDVLGWADADHGETAPPEKRLVVTPLACFLEGATGTILLHQGSRIEAAYGARKIEETYNCKFGINPAFAQELFAGALRVTAEDDKGELRAVELDGHPFFVGVLFQPERAGLRGLAPPLVTAFLRAAAARNRQ